MRYILLSSMLLAALMGNAQQQNPADCFDEQYKSAESHLQKGRLYEALEASFVAENCYDAVPSDRAEKLKSFRAKVRNEMKKQDDNLKKLKADNESAAKKVKMTQAQLDSATTVIKNQEQQLAANKLALEGSKAALEKERAALRKKQQELEEAATFQKAFNFYYNKWAVVYLADEGGYSYISREGKQLVPGRVYGKINGFDSTYYHLSLVTDTSKKVTYYVDTLGNECAAATKLSDINEHTGLIDLRNQNLTEIPAEIAKCKKLRYLLLSGNKIKEVPEFVGNLRTLIMLNLAENQVDSLPESIGNLQQLHTLYLSGNPLKDLPQSLSNMSELHDIFIDRRLESILKQRMTDKRPTQRKEW